MRNVTLATALAGALLASGPGLIAPAGAQSAASPFGFTVQVSLSAQALKRLQDFREGVTVRSFYYGKRARKPSAAEIKRALADGEDPGQVDLVGDTVTLPSDGGTAEMPGRGIRAADAAKIGPNPVNVNINVFSARKAAPDNLLDCDLFDDAVAVARSKPIAVTCRLIGER